MPADLAPIIVIVEQLFLTFFPIMIIIFVLFTVLRVFGIDFFDLFGLESSRNKKKGYSDIADTYQAEKDREASDKYQDQKPNYSQECFKCGEDRHRGEIYCNKCGWEFK